MLSSYRNALWITGPFLRGIHQSLVNFPHKRPVMQSSDIFFVVNLNKPLNKQFNYLWFKMQRSCGISVVNRNPRNTLHGNCEILNKYENLLSRKCICKLPAKYWPFCPCHQDLLLYLGMLYYTIASSPRGPFWGQAWWLLKDQFSLHCSILPFFASSSMHSQFKCITQTLLSIQDMLGSQIQGSPEAIDFNQKGM